RFRLRERVEAAVARGLVRLPRSLQLRLAGGASVHSDEGDVLAPDVQLVLSLCDRVGRTGLDALPVPEARRRLRRDSILYGGRPEPVARVEDLSIDGAAGAMPARLYAPASLSPAPLLVFFHGGGFVAGDLDTHDAVCRTLCRHAGVRVLSVAYRLAPEHPFPAAVEDARAAFRFACANAPALGADPARVAVGGDSAGGNLAAVVALLAAREGEPLPALQLLLYPALDRHTPYPSLEQFADRFLLTRTEIAWFHAQYAGGPGVPRRDPRLSPVCAPELSGVPPALVVTAAFDPLRDEGEAYAAALRASGTKVTLRRMPGVVHGFVNMMGVSPTSRAAVLEVARELRAALVGGGG
ncbi:MAG TPA: alpha/beta hydrolase, partial [Anaeromyxobacteraceae bacterium]|nr:alpha/beta hydrolase [Anaeromyxobacteraceae bacterium]